MPTIKPTVPDIITDNSRKLEQLYSRWLIGDGTPPDSRQLPKDIASALIDTPEDKRALYTLALVGQYQALLLKKQPKPQDANELIPLATLPLAKLPILPTSLWSLARRILLNSHSDVLITLLLRFLCTHGYMLPPSDALSYIVKLPIETLPQAYQPWHEWHQSLNRQTYYTAHYDELTIDNWQDWSSSELIRTLKYYRQNHRQDTLTLISDGVKLCKSELRAKVVETLAINLSTDDVVLLKELCKDRSQKVADLARQLLARLGIVEDIQEQVQTLAKELACYYELKEHNNKTRVIPKKLKSTTQANMRCKQLASIYLPAFAQALGISMSQLITGWQFSDDLDNQNILTNMMQHLSDDDFTLLTDTLSQHIAKHPKDFDLLDHISNRLNDATKQHIAERLLYANVSFTNIAKLTISPFNINQLTDLPHWQSFISSIESYLAKHDVMDNHQIALELQVFGLMVSQDIAKQVFDLLTDMGVPRTSDALSTLNLNCHLS